MENTLNNCSKIIFHGKGRIIVFVRRDGNNNEGHGKEAKSRTPAAIGKGT